MIIELSNGGETVIDDADYDWLVQKRWRKTSTGYAVCGSGMRGIPLYMHRLILLPPDDREVDHINGDRLDNRRVNLRFATASQQMANKPKVSRTNRFKGVCWKHNKWEAQITVDGLTLYLGRFEDELEAARAYDRAARMAFREYALPNLPYGA